MDEKTKKEVIVKDNDDLSNIPGSKEVAIEEKDAKPFDEQIEEERIKLQGLYKKSQTTSNIFTFGALALMIGGLIMLVQKQVEALPVVGGVLLGLAIVVLLVGFFVNKNKFPNATKVYIKKVSTLLNSHLFTNGQFKDIKSDELEKIEQSDVLSDGVYNMIANIGSRNVVSGLYGSRSFQIADLAVYKVGQKRNKPDLSFIGKRIEYPNDLHLEGRIIVSVFNPNSVEVEEKGEKVEKPSRVDAPTNIDDLKVIEESANCIVYGPDGVDYKSILGKKFLDYLSSIKLGETLLNANFVFWAGHSVAYLSYGDDVIGLPFEKPFKGRSFDNFKKDFEALLEGLSLLVK